MGCVAPRQGNGTATTVLFWATLFLGRERILLAIGDFLMIQDELKPADVIHVTAGEINRVDYGKEARR